MSSIKTRAHLHITRKLWHFFGVLTIIVLFHNVDRPLALQLAAFLAVGCFSIDFFRLRHPKLNEKVMFFVKPIMRKNEIDQFAGTTYLSLGVFIIIYLFPKPVVALSLLFLAIADPLASLFGIRYGKDKLLGNKTLQGTIAAFIICTVISAVFFYSKNFMIDRLVIVSLLSGMIGALGELASGSGLDDNFTLPIISSVGLWGLFYLFGGYA